MAATLKNQFWKYRNKHGRNKLFESPEALWEAACSYFEWCDNNPWMKNEALKGGEKAGKIIQIPTARPFTLRGLCLYLDCNEAYFRNFKNQEREESEDFITIIERIEDVIYTQKFEGAAIGVFNTNIIARDLGLTDKVDHTTKGEAIRSLQIEIIHTQDTGDKVA